MPVNSFKWKHYEGEIILLNVRWYLKYALSYRNLKEMMAERGIKVDHTTIMRLVHQYLFSCHTGACEYEPTKAERKDYCALDFLDCPRLRVKLFKMYTF
jgi:transposase-like protein